MSHDPASIRRSKSDVDNAKWWRELKPWPPCLFTDADRIEPRDYATRLPRRPDRASYASNASVLCFDFGGDIEHRGPGRGRNQSRGKLKAARARRRA
jgi:hypothetical protein